MNLKPTKRGKNTTNKLYLKLLIRKIKTYYQKIVNTINKIPGLSCDGDKGAAIWAALRRRRGRKAAMREWRRDERGREAELWQHDGMRKRGSNERVIETWECEDWEWFLREAETSEGWGWLRKGFRVRLRVILREGFRMMPYRGEKKKRLDDVVCLQKQGRRFRTMPYRGEKKKRGWTTSFKGWNKETVQTGHSS